MLSWARFGMILYGYSGFWFKFTKELMFLFNIQDGNYL